MNCHGMKPFNLETDTLVACPVCKRLGLPSVHGICFACANKGKSYLTQIDIDRLEPKKESWFDVVPGGWSTLIVLICFAAGMWGLWLLWQVRGR